MGARAEGLLNTKGQHALALKERTLPLALKERTLQ